MTSSDCGSDNVPRSCNGICRVASSDPTLTFTVTLAELAARRILSRASNRFPVKVAGGVVGAEAEAVFPVIAEPVLSVWWCVLMPDGGTFTGHSFHMEVPDKTLTGWEVTAVLHATVDYPDHCVGDHSEGSLGDVSHPGDPVRRGELLAGSVSLTLLRVGRRAHHQIDRLRGRFLEERDCVSGLQQHRHKKLLGSADLNQPISSPHGGGIPVCAFSGSSSPRSHLLRLIFI